MVSLDQVVLLNKKVEAAVAKINSLNAELAQLYSENDALRRKCTELTNALADKTGLVSSLEAEQNRIEKGILDALDQLDTVEDAALATIAYDDGRMTESSDAELDQGSVPIENVSQPESVESAENGAVNPSNPAQVMDPLALSFDQQQNQADGNQGNDAEGSPDEGEKTDGGNQFDIF